MRETQERNLLLTEEGLILKSKNHNFMIAQELYKKAFLKGESNVYDYFIKTSSKQMMFDFSILKFKLVCIKKISELVGCPITLSEELISDYIDEMYGYIDFEDDEYDYDEMYDACFMFLEDTGSYSGNKLAKIIQKPLKGLKHVKSFSFVPPTAIEYEFVDEDLDNFIKETTDNTVVFFNANTGRNDNSKEFRKQILDLIDYVTTLGPEGGIPVVSIRYFDVVDDDAIKWLESGYVELHQTRSYASSIKVDGGVYIITSDNQLDVNTGGKANQLLKVLTPSAMMCYMYEKIGYEKGWWSNEK